jgi:sugar lactone lactonase YvrE
MLNQAISPDRVHRWIAAVAPCVAFALALVAGSASAETVSAPLTVTTFAGTADVRQNTDGTGTAARFYAPAGLVIDGSGNLIVADTCNNIFRKVTAGAVVTLYAAAPYDPINLPNNVGAVDGAGTDARIHIGDSQSRDGSKFGPPTYTTIGSMTLGIDAAGNVYFADTLNDTIRKITPAGVISTIAGSAGNQGSTDGNGTDARFDTPGGVAVDSAGNIYVADSGNDTVRKISPAGVVSTLAGTAKSSGSSDGTGAAAQFANPSGIAVDSSGNVYVADTANHTIRKITSSGVVTTFAGSAGHSGTADGAGTQARFNSPAAVAVDSSSNVYVADTENHAIRKISPAGTVATIAGSIGTSGSADGTGTSASFYEPYGIAVDASGNVYVADTSNDTIRKGVPATGSGSLQILEVPPTLIQTTTTDSFSIKVVASGTPTPTYQWYKDGTAVSGATSNTLQISSAASGDAGHYSVLVTSGVVTYTSAPTLVQVFAHGTPVPSVQIVSQPAAVSVAAGQSASFTVEATSASALTYQWKKNGTIIAGATSSTYSIASAQSADAATYTVDVSDGSSTATTSNAVLTVTGTTTVAPSITTQPSSQSVSAGATATFTAGASGTPAPTYQWQKNGVALSNTGTLSGATTSTLTITNAQSTDEGSYTVVATNTAGSVTSNAATLTVGSTPPPPPPTNAGRIINMSVLTSIDAADASNNNFTFGYYLGGSGTSGNKPILMRAMGPSLLPLGVTNYLADPSMEFYNISGSVSTLVSTNDDWGGDETLKAVAAALQAFPFVSDTSKDSAIYSTTVSPDLGHSIKVKAKTGSSGSVIAELYDATASDQFTATTPRLINVSIMKNVGAITTMGFFVGGSSNVKVLVRAIGPTIGASPFNVPGTMADPKMSVYPLNSTTLLASNDNWGGTADLKAAFTATNAFGLPDNSKDAAVLLTLAPGGYTVQVTASTGSTGVALIEVYEVPQ